MNTKRRFLHNNFSPFLQLCCGGILFLFFALNSSLWVRGLQLSMLGFLAWANGKHIRWWYFIILILSVVFAHQFIPFGRVLFQWRSITITEGSLRLGVAKGMFFTGFTFVSLFAVRRDLQMPGVVGKVISCMLYSFESLVMRSKPRLSSRYIASAIMTAYTEIQNIPTAPPHMRTSRTGWVIFILLFLCFALLYGGGRL